MLQRPKCQVIALEEHYWDKELAAQFVGGEGVRDPEMLKRLYDLGEVRLKEMDEAGIDVQILSHGAPSAQKLSGAEFDKAYEERTMFILTMHPHVIGHRSRVAMLERLVRYMRSRPGVWFATHEEIARFVGSKKPEADR